jgi:hypothetical protein
MSHEIKNILKAGLLIVAIIALGFIASQFVAVNFDGITTNAGGGCIAVAFDKASVMGADKIVLYRKTEVITITDKDLVREIAAQFVVANRTGLCESQSGEWMEIYNGGRLVRTVYWSDCVDNFAHIYEADDLHWIFPGEGGIGQLELPREFMERLEEIIQSQRE